MSAGKVAVSNPSVQAIAGVVTTKSDLAKINPVNLAGQVLTMAGGACTLAPSNQNTQITFSCPNVQVRGAARRAHVWVLWGKREARMLSGHACAKACKCLCVHTHTHTHRHAAHAHMHRHAAHAHMHMHAHTHTLTVSPATPLCRRSTTTTR